jgi:CcmD family protein
MIESNQTFIIAAYAATWGTLLAYLVYLTRRGGRVRAEYERMARGDRNTV